LAVFSICCRQYTWLPKMPILRESRLNKLWVGWDSNPNQRLKSAI
jgi:hypothetical protein